MFKTNHLLLFCINFICLSYAAREPPTVTIPNQGTIVGKEISLIRTQRIFAYLGIPYVKKPERFAPPDMEDLPSWDDVRNATEFETSCMQVKEAYLDEELPFIHLLTDDLTFNISEDCLFLNVFVPYGQPPPEDFAVIVWIHPGNFRTGSPNMWNPYSLVFKQRVIVVTIAYRLNVLGFFTTMDGEAVGNYGLMDQVAALTWIKNNIAVFGGNPSSITIMGYGAGAVSVGIHMVSPSSKGLFTKAIAMSGNLLNSNTVKYPQEDKSVVDDIAIYFSCFRYPTSLLLDCLRRAPAESLVQFGLQVDWKPIIDLGISNNSNPILSDMPKNFFERGDFNSVPFLTGFTDMEEVLANRDILHSDKTDAPEEYLSLVLSDFISRDLPSVNLTDTCIYNHDHILDSVMFFYRPAPPAQTHSEIRKTLTDFLTERNYGSSTYLLAQYISKHKPTFMYRFDMKPSTDGAVAELPSWVSVPHLFDLIYLWGMPYWAELPTKQEWDNRDKRISDIIMNFWTNFAKSSNPTEGSIFAIKWDQFEIDKPGILIIDRTFNMSDHIQLNYKAFDFWNDYYPKVIDIATQCCNATSNGFDLSPSFNWLLYILYSVSLTPTIL